MLANVVDRIRKAGFRGLKLSPSNQVSEVKHRLSVIGVSVGASVWELGRTFYVE